MDSSVHPFNPRNDQVINLTDNDLTFFANPSQNDQVIDLTGDDITIKSLTLLATTSRSSYSPYWRRHHD